MNTVIKKLTLITGIVLFFSARFAFAQEGDDVYPKVVPNPVIVGKDSELRLISIAGHAEILDFPTITGIKWAKTPPMTSLSSNMVTREKVFKTIYSFTVSKEGEYVIPGIKVKIGHLTKKTNPFKFKAYKQKMVDSQGNEYAIDDLLYISALLMTQRDYVYVGEEIPLQIRLYSVNGLQLSWLADRMEIDVENIVMKDYSNINPKLPYFSSSDKKQVKVKDQVFNAFILKSALRSISTGTLEGPITVPARMRLPTRHILSDPYQNIKLSADIGPKKVKPLPPIKNNAQFLGLVGEWDVKFQLSSQTLKAGEPVTLKVMLKGQGTLDTLTPPEIKLEGFRIFPPEVKKEPRTSPRFEEGEIRYAIIPKITGESKVNVSFSTFSPMKEKYVVKSFSGNFEIEQSDDPSAGLVHDSEPDDGSLSTGAPGTGNRKSLNGILYLKTEKMGKVRIPLQDNKFGWIIILFLIGPAFLIASELISYQRQKLSKDPLLRRKNSAKRKKRSVMNKLKSADGKDELYEIIQNDLTPLINDLYGFPPGTSTDELAEKVADPKLSACLKSGSSSSYMPGNTAEFNAESLKTNLIKAMKKLPIILLLFFGASLLTAEDITVKNDSRTLYDNQDFKGAAKLYLQELDEKKPDPAILYNIGNCEFKKGNLPKALVYYERAKRLAPSDSDILENLNLVRRKLTLPEIGKSQDPIDSIENFRDSFRPDGWLLAIALTWSLCWFSLVARRFVSTRKWVSGLVISALLLTISILAYTSQTSTTYNPENAIVVQRGTEVFMLPSGKSEKAGFKLRAGEDVTIEEERHNWLRVRDDHSEGWIKSNTVERLWPS